MLVVLGLHYVVRSCGAITERPCAYLAVDLCEGSGITSVDLDFHTIRETLCIQPKDAVLCTTIEEAYVYIYIYIYM